MRKILLSLLTAASISYVGHSQINHVEANFDTLSLPKQDTFYVNYSSLGNNVGFTDGVFRFPCVYDTSGGYSFWESGFSYSNMTDSTTSGFGNQYAAKAGSGSNGSPQYAVAYGQENYINLTTSSFSSSFIGFYITNSTYAYNSMRDGDAFAKKFGGASGNDPDWFKLEILGYWVNNGNATLSSTKEFYLADFRDTNNANDYIIKDWTWVNMQYFQADSVVFRLSSSDTGQFGMNTPAYFCMDDLTWESYPDAINEIQNLAAKVYPNPAIHDLHIELLDSKAKTIQVLDVNGKVLKALQANSKINTISIADLPKGMYWVQIYNGQQTASQRFIKQ